ncbi:MAG: LytR family transcriptional regulator [Actinobacteria bacterium]|nr:MAG: LytR family transcriptional regulator [Actinomycetota bacterium]
MGKHYAPRSRSRSRVAPRGRRSSVGRIVEPSPRLRAHKQNRNRAIKRAVLVAVTVIALLVVGVAAYAFLTMRSIDKTIKAGVGSNSQTVAALTKPVPKQPFTILLMGSDARPEEEAARADTIIVARVDPQTKQVSMLSIPRDTRVEIPGHGTSKINAANFYGGAEGGPALMIKTVEGFLGIKINHYMEVNFIGFQKAVDALGGVWIDVDTTIDDPKAASHSPHPEAQHIEKGYQLLSGEYALTYVRSRAFPDADFTRMKHQQTFFKALAEQSSRLENLPKLPAIAREVAKYTATDMSVGEMIDIIMAIKGIKATDLQTATIPGTWKSPYVWTDEEEKARLVTAFSAGRAFDATSTAEAPLAPSTISVTVRNGAGQEGVASSASSILRAAGFTIGEVGNANQFVYDKTLVVYKDEANKAGADLVASKLPTGSVVASRGMYEFTSDVLVVVGKDWKAAVAGGSSAQ